MEPGTTPEDRPDVAEDGAVGPGPAVEGVREVEDRRPPSYGLARLLVVVLAVLGAVILVPAAVDLVRHPAQAPVIGSLNVAIGILYLVLAVCVAHNGRRMRMIGWMCVSALATGAVLFGLLTWTGTVPGLSGSVWSDGGARHLYLPLLLPVVTAAWMWMSDPRRIVMTAERRDGHVVHLRRSTR